METFYLPSPKALVDFCDAGIRNPQLRITKNALTVFNKIINSTEPETILPQPQNFKVDEKTTLSKNQEVYDLYFGVNRSSENPIKVLEHATLKASELLQIELQRGSNLSAVEITSLSSGIVTVLSMLEGSGYAH